ncbi:MAG: histidine phosphatase family protein [Pseudomonadota bacterium]
MRLYLIRHPQPEVAPDTCYGRSDLAANEAHCGQVLQAVSARLPAGIPVISSPLQRCAVLAHRLAEATQSVAPLLDARLMELDFGSWELRRWGDIPRTEIEAWAQDPVNYRPGGGESVIAMAARVIDFLQDLPQRYGRHNIGPALVCHSGPIRTMLAYRSGISAGELATLAVASREKIQYGQCVAWVLPALN